MKRSITLAGLLCLVLIPKLHAMSDFYGSERPAMWRSSSTCSQENLVLLASGSVHVHSIDVASATLNVESWVALFNSTTPATALSNFNLTTGTFVNTSIIGTGSQMDWSHTKDVYYSSGVVVNKSAGSACVEILWDYVVPRTSSVVPFKP